MSGSVTKDILTSGFDEFGSEVMVEQDGQHEWTLGSHVEVEGQHNHNSAHEPEEFDCDPSLDDVIDIKYEGCGIEHNTTLDGEDDRDLEVGDWKLSQNEQVRVKLDRISESEFQRRLPSRHEFVSNTKHEIEALSGSKFSVPCGYQEQGEESNTRNKVAEDLIQTKIPSIDDEMDIKYEDRSIAGNSIVGADDDLDLDLDLDPGGRFIKTNPKPGSPESIHFEQKEEEFQELCLDLLQCDRECEICLVYIRRLRDHVKATHVGQVRLTQDPLLIDPVDLDQSPVTEFKYDVGEVETRERLESSEESDNESNPESDSDPDFNIEGESDPGDRNSGSPPMAKRDKINRRRKQKVGIEETWKQRTPSYETAKTVKRVRRGLNPDSSEEESRDEDSRPESDEECAGDSDSDTDYRPTPKSTGPKSRRRRKTSRKNLSKTQAGDKVNDEGATNFTSKTKSASQSSQNSERKSNKRPPPNTHTTENASQGLFNTRCQEENSKGDGRSESDVDHNENRKPLHQKKLKTVSKKSRSKPECGRKSYKCGECGKYFTTSRSLTEHKRVHTDVRLYKCDVCEKSFKTSSDLSSHKRVHTGERPYKCSVCVKSFKKSSHLTEHERVHTGERPHKCDVCAKSFKTSSALTEHKRVHTGEKPFICDVCEKSFKTCSHLSQHKRVHAGEKPFVCKKCGMIFTQNVGLRIHKRSHTGEKP